ncbi:hypothetical protein J8281_16290 [Aquimarina sp. U1-2]|uniref:hypothetical protein n=1 Tax=Aquimarina sp. U1-2 TaxID=2823141 RepID=UPI001AEC7C2C|nr:hypothetical protein [Aquimarina sp. U1-2]MBP2833756.1 hypothetical protein [Aquimarina sp. U1-2]
MMFNILAILIVLTSIPMEAQDKKIKYHAAVVHPAIWYSSAAGVQHTFDATNLAFPVGAIFGINERWSYNFELVPITDTRALNMVVWQQGLLYRFRSDIVGELKSAIEIGGRGAYAFNMVINKVFAIPSKGKVGPFFLAGVLVPVRFGRNVTDGETIVPSIILAGGISF